jgi:hypothetical protein
METQKVFLEVFCRMSLSCAVNDRMHGKPWRGILVLFALGATGFLIIVAKISKPGIGVHSRNIRARVLDSETSDTIQGIPLSLAGFGASEHSLEVRMSLNTRLRLDIDLSNSIASDPVSNLRPVPLEYSTAFVLLAHNRFDYIKRTIGKVLEARESEKFSILVSVDSKELEDAVREAVLSVPNPKEIPIQYISSELPFATAAKFKGEPAIGRHLAAVFNHVFRQSLYEYVIVLEDDLDVSPDFFEYFASVGELLHPRHPASKGLFCASAWNDHAFSNLELDPSRAIRTDWYPGLGFLIHRSAWLGNLESEWPIWDTQERNYDHWLRFHSTIMKTKDCIAPEMPRTHHFALTGMHVVGSAGDIYSRMRLSDGNYRISESSILEISDPLAVRRRFTDMIAKSTEVDINTLTGPFVGDQFKNGIISFFFEDRENLRDPVEAELISKRFELYPSDFRMRFRGLWTFALSETRTRVIIIAESMRDYWDSSL